MIIGTSQQRAKVSINSLRVGTATVTSVSSARNQDSWFDSKLAMAIYISIYLKATPRLWFMPLFHADSITVTVFYMACRSINSISYSMCRACVQDQYAVKVNIVSLLLHQLDLHWLPVKFGIEFKILLIVFKIFKSLVPSYLSLLITPKPVSTILDKTVEKIVYLDSIFLNIVAVPVLPSPPSPESNVVVHSKESLIPGRLWEATLILGEGVFFPQRRRFGNSFQKLLLNFQSA